MNLSASPWIPVRHLDGSPSLLSLNELFQQAENIRDLSVNPQERIALTRLLICLTQAACGFPEDSNDWPDTHWNLATTVPAYLKKWQDHFQLLGKGPRFLQRELPSSEKPYPLDQINFLRATGNSPTVLDHRLNDLRTPEADTALDLLVYQNFFIGGMMASKVKGNGPALKSLHTFIQDKTLAATIRANCLDEESLLTPTGRPIWEIPEDAENATRTYLGRLVPLPCRVWLEEDLSGIRIAQGFQAPELIDFARESSNSLIVGYDDKLRILRAQPERGLWRDLTALTIGRRATESESAAPPILQSHKEEYLTSGHIPLWSGELIKAVDAKILDSTESSFQLPQALFSETGRTRYDQGVKYAEIWSGKARKAAFAYGKALLVDKPDTAATLRHFWHTLDQQAHLLLETVQQPPIDPLWQDPWHTLVRQAAYNAYRAACPAGAAHSRNLLAHAAGLRAFKPSSKKIAKKATTPSS